MCSLPTFSISLGQAENLSSRNKEIQHFFRKFTQLSAYTQTIFVIFQHTEIQYFLNYSLAWDLPLTLIQPKRFCLVT